VIQCYRSYFVAVADIAVGMVADTVVVVDTEVVVDK